ncbi:MAG: ribose transport system ATP-binding protein [Planctomycetota bacterium]|jgi:ribose transport system ATP-binding protein
MPSIYKLETRGLRKEYPGTLALADVSIGFNGGEVHALIGKNGAGKSTLVKMLAGSLQPTSGQILVDGSETALSSPTAAFQRGIATVYQELSLVPSLTVAENMLLGRLPQRGPFIDWRATYARAEAVLADLQIDLDVRQRAGSLGVAQQQVVEIAKAMSADPSVLMLDEPTSALARHETDRLFALVRRLAARGVAIIYISHRLQELHQIADRITVLRDGHHIDTRAMADTSAADIVHMMFGEVVQRPRPQDVQVGTQPALRVKNLQRVHAFRDINFTLYEGEVLGIAGMLGAGRTELLKSLFGAEPFDSGQIEIAGQIIATPTPMRMKEHGIAFTPENRKEEALVQTHSIRANMCMAGMKRIARGFYTTRALEQEHVDTQVERLQIKVADTEHTVSSLSGGNQQKVVVANWLNNHPRIVLFDEPTRGIDVQAKQQIFQVMWDLSRDGIASIFVSTELEELHEVCHRILIMQNGRIVDEVRPEQIAPDELYIRCMEGEG